MITREQAKEKLKSFGIEEPTDEQVTDYLNSISSEISASEEKARKFKEEADKAKALKEELDEIKNQNLTNEEKAQKSLEAANARIAELEKQNITSEVKAILSTTGIKEEEIAQFADAFSSFDLDTAKAKASALAKTFTTALDAREKAVKEELLDNTQGSGGGGDPEDKKSQAEKDAEARAKAKAEAAKTSNDILSQYGIGGN